jgi:S1-C subfamily serine protease
VVADGMVLTAAHVVDDADRSIEVDGRTASIVGVDARTDLALLSVATGGWQRVPLARVDAGAGDEVTIATADGDIATVVDRAVTLDVTDVTDDTRWRRETLVLATGVEGGTSGAPVLDGAGRMTGVVVLSSRSGGQAYAVTGGEVRRFVDGSRAAGNRTSLAVTTGCA